MEPDNQSTTEQPTVAVQQATSRSKSKWLIRSILAVIVILPLLIAGLPTFVSILGLQNVVLEQATGQQEISASAGSASLGWLNRILLDDAKLSHDDGTLTVSAPSFRTERSLIDILLGFPDVGTIILEQPTIVLQPDDSGGFGNPDEGENSDQPNALPQLEAVVRDASVKILLPADSEPVIAIDGISFEARTQRSVAATTVTVDPVKLLDRRRLTPELCDRGLQLIAPVLSEATNVTGELTVDLHEFQMPINGASPEERSRLTKISGQIVLHEVETSLRNPVLAQIASVITKLSGGQFSSIRVAEESQVDFRVENGQVHHQGLTLVAPEFSKNLSIQTDGWVDLEENVDIRILVNLAGLAPSQVPMLASLTQAPIELHMTGTLQQPKIKLPEGRDLLDELAGRLSSEDSTSIPGDKPHLTGAISNLVDGIVGESQKKPDVEKTARGIFDLIRAIQDDPKKSK